MGHFKRKVDFCKNDSDGREYFVFQQEEYFKKKSKTTFYSDFM